VKTSEQIAEQIATAKLSEQMPEDWGDLLDVIAEAIEADRADQDQDTVISTTDIAYEIRWYSVWEICETFVSTNIEAIDAKRKEWLSDPFISAGHTIHTYRWENGERIEMGYESIY